jgi:hypothetical protein
MAAFGAALHTADMITGLMFYITQVPITLLNMYTKLFNLTCVLVFFINMYDVVVLE